MIKSKFILILLFFFVSNVSNAETQSTKLNKLFKILETIDNKTDAGEVEKEIWTLWNNHPKSKQLTYKLELGTELMYEGNYLYALQVFNNVIKSFSLTLSMILIIDIIIIIVHDFIEIVLGNIVDVKF